MQDVMLAFDAFWHLDTRKFHAINEAIMVLLPKAPDATTIKDYQPISLIHVLGKLFSNVLANRLSSRLAQLIHVSQSAFVKGRYIQDNFKYVQSVAKTLNARCRPALLLKVEISRSFDSVSWLFLIDVMAHVGFPLAWRDWIAALLSSASTRIMLNGMQGERICHARGFARGIHFHRCCFYW
jgi:hypothetical protein